MTARNRDDDEPALCRVMMVLCACTLTAALWFALSGCAAVGNGDPIIVRAEDTLSNSLRVYDETMKLHFANSRDESPDTYRTLERFRTDFPTAWQTLFDAVRLYRSTRDSGQLTREIDRLRALMDDVTTFNRNR